MREVCEGQRAHSDSQFSLSTFTWVPEVELRTSGLCSQGLQPWSHLTVPINTSFNGVWVGF